MKTSITDKIHIGLTPQGDFEVLLPKEAVADLYTMIVGAGLQERRQFWQVKTTLEEQYRDLIQRKPERRKEDRQP